MLQTAFYVVCKKSVNQYWNQYLNAFKIRNQFKLHVDIDVWKASNYPNILYKFIFYSFQILNTNEQKKTEGRIDA